MKQILLTSCIVLLAGCGQMAFPGLGKPKPAPATGQTRPLERPAIAERKPPEAARTQEDFDTTTVEERKAALAKPVSGGGGALGVTVASLGDPTVPGFWIKTPLVKAAGKGKVTYAKSGRTVQVDLIPLDGPVSGGSQLSLATMRLLDAPLTDLPEVQVFAE